MIQKKIIVRTYLLFYFYNAFIGHHNPKFMAVHSTQSLQTHENPDQRHHGWMMELLRETFFNEFIRLPFLQKCNIIAV